MATNRLTDNDISSLAQIFDTTLQFYCKHISPLEDDYLKKLSTIMGLGFTAVLVDGDLLAVYEPYLQEFIRYRKFKEYPGHIGILSRSVAKMIDGAAFLFGCINQPRYYDEFVIMVKSTAAHITVHQAGKAEEAERLMRILFQKSH